MIIDLYKNQIYLIKRENLKRWKRIIDSKMTGYISFVQGEDPYYFPFRIYPKDINH